MLYSSKPTGPHLLHRLLIDIRSNNMVEIKGDVDVIDVLEESKKRFRIFKADAFTIDIFLLDFLKKVKINASKLFQQHKLFFGINLFVRLLVPCLSSCHEKATVALYFGRVPYMLRKLSIFEFFGCLFDFFKKIKSSLYSLNTYSSVTSSGGHPHHFPVPHHAPPHHLEPCSAPRTI